jgi:hypothetical protein
VKRKKVHDPVRILSVGNDPHRDWQVLIRAIKDYSACYLKIVSRKLNKRKELITSNNIELVYLFSDEKIASKILLDLFYWADMVVFTMRSNLHASGITVLQEAAIRGGNVTVHLPWVRQVPGGSLAVRLSGHTRRFL